MVLKRPKLLKISNYRRATYERNIIGKTEEIAKINDIFIHNGHTSPHPMAATIRVCCQGVLRFLTGGRIREMEGEHFLGGVVPSKKRKKRISRHSNQQPIAHRSDNLPAEPYGMPNLVLVQALNKHVPVTVPIVYYGIP